MQARIYKNGELVRIKYLNNMTTMDKQGLEKLKKIFAEINRLNNKDLYYVELKQNLK